tara:strand:+ start:154 stop:330 length:177 start_codon:yes stop_codon:yes gene_type:complete
MVSRIAGITFINASSKREARKLAREKYVLGNKRGIRVGKAHDQETWVKAERERFNATG